MKKIKNEIFKNKSYKIHNNIYDYSLVEYINSYTKVKIICKEHGVFVQRPNNHLSGQGCPKCKIDKNKKSIINITEEFNNIHDNTYNYSLVEYINSHTKVKIICKKHGIFEQTPSNHLKGKGCPKCYGNHKKSNTLIINDFNYVHNDVYDYSLVDYKNNKTKIKIICKEHGIFEQTPYSHLSGSGCPKCYGNNKKTTDSIIINFNIIHNDKYDYSLVEYTGYQKKVKIICQKHGVFKQTPKNHILGQGCPICNFSKGEEEIKKYLDINNITYKYQFIFNDCKYKKPLKFDFYLPDYNICIEYDGKQHFEKYKFEKDDKNLKIRKIRDEIKTNYCKINNIKLIRIKYNENIKKKLNGIKTNFKF